MNQNIVYEDNELIVCHKPAGTATQTRQIGRPDMVSLMRNYRAQNGQEPYIGLVHRLDQPVEGLMVFAKTAPAAAELSKQVQTHRMQKYYCAAGLARAEAVDGAWIRLTDYVVYDKKRNLASIVSAQSAQAKKAVLEYRVIGRREGLVCFDIALYTGRHHQIRLQMAHHGFPLLGDTKYGGGVKQADAGDEGSKRGGAQPQLALCAYRLVFFHPVDGRKMDVSVKPDNAVFEGFFP